MTRRLLVSYLSLTMVILLGFGIALGLTYASDQRQRAQRLFEREAAVLADLVEQDIRLQDYDDLPRLAAEYARLSDGRVLILDRQAKVLASAPEATTAALSDGEQRDLMTALAGGRATSTRDSATLGTEVFSVAVPAASGGTTLGAVHLAAPADEVTEAIHRVVVALTVGALVILGCVAAIGIALARWTIRPIRALENATDRLARGVLDTPAATNIGPPELRRLAATFNGMAQAVELAMQRQEAFVADASHQLRNPLMALVLRLEALAMNLDDEQRQQLEPAREEATRLGVILDELLDLATALHIAAQPEVIDVASLIRARLDAWQPLADRRPVRLHGPADPTAVEAVADPILVSSALDSILDNAVKFSPVDGAVAVHLAAGATTVRIDVIDDGPGLDEEDLAHIGDRFWRSTANQNIPGCGLGLNIARALLDATGGTLSFATVDPHGLHVTLHLPRVAGGAA